MIVAKEWTENLLRLHGRDKEIAKETSSIIHDDEYWTDVTIVSSVFDPLVKVFRMVDSDDKVMGFFVRGYGSCNEEYKETLERR